MNYFYLFGATLPFFFILSYMVNDKKNNILNSFINELEKKSQNSFDQKCKNQELTKELEKVQHLALLPSTDYQLKSLQKIIDSHPNELTKVKEEISKVEAAYYKIKSLRGDSSRDDSGSSWSPNLFDQQNSSDSINSFMTSMSSFF